MCKIKVGFIGLNPDSHWASTAHIPALKSLSEDFEVVGVANSTLESAQRTAKALHLKHAFATPHCCLRGYRSRRRDGQGSVPL
ncbi:MAG: hypothetical protein AB7D27_12965 [Desulfomicrobium sp.]